MKKLLLLTTALMASGVVLAQEVGRVISATPIIQQVGTPRQVCTTETVAVQAPKSGAGGAMGNAVGGGSGKAVATLIGLMGGAIVGDQLEGAPPSQLQNVQRCSSQNFVENRTVAYNVVYEFSGKRYSVQMPQDPGPTLQVQITPVGANPAPPPQQVIASYQPPVYVQPAVVVVPQPYRSYYTRPYYAPISMELDLGYGHHYRGRRHWN